MKTNTNPHRRAQRGATSIVVASIAALSVTAAALAASPVNGSVVGPVVWVHGSSFRITTPLSPKGSSTVQTTSSTVITEQASGSRSDLVKGVCVTAVGPKNSKGVVAATRISVSQPVKGKCGSGFRGRRPPNGQRPRGTPPPGTGNPGGFANFGFANGAISAVQGTTLTVHSAQRGNTTVTVSASTQISKTVRVTSSAIKLKMCAFVRGTSSDKGVTVKAQSVSLSQPRGGSCAFGRPQG